MANSFFVLDVWICDGLLSIGTAEFITKVPGVVVHCYSVSVGQQCSDFANLVVIRIREAWVDRSQAFTLHYCQHYNWGVFNFSKHYVDHSKMLSCQHLLPTPVGNDDGSRDWFMVHELTTRINQAIQHYQQTACFDRTKKLTS